jgi:NAD+ diphosphatase
MQSSIDTPYWFIFQNGLLVLLAKENSFVLPQRQDVPFLTPHMVRQHAFLSLQNIQHVSAELNPEYKVTAPLQVFPLRKAFELLGEEWFNICVKAYSIINWDKNHQYCGRCGHLTVHQSPGFERLCLNCQLLMYPRISPSIIVLIQKGHEVLMARSPHFSPGAFGLIAGFVEIGESIEEAVHREVQEEVGIKIKNLQYFGSQPWPFPDSLMIGFMADYANGEIMIDNKEIEAAAWYNYNELPPRSASKINIAARLIDHFVAIETAKKANNGN